MNVETSCAVIKLRFYGVEHHNVRPPNVLWNSECGNIMLVDFEWLRRDLEAGASSQGDIANLSGGVTTPTEGDCVATFLQVFRWLIALLLISIWCTFVPVIAINTIIC